MASLRTTVRSTTGIGRFAHLLGIPVAKASRRAEDDEPRSPKEDDDSGAKGRADDEERDDEAAEPDDDEVDDAEEDEDGDKKSKKSKKAKSANKAASDDEECEDEEYDEADAKAVRAGRRLERARCRAIFESTAAAVRPDLAAHLAFTTSMSAKEAVALLEVTAAGQPVPDRRAERPAARPRVDLGDGGAKPSVAKGLAAQIIEAGKKRRGEV